MHPLQAIASAPSHRMVRRFGVPTGLLLVAIVAFTDGVRLILDATSARPSAPAGWYLCTVAAVLAVTAVLATARDGDDARDATTPAEAADGDGLTQAWRAIALMVLYAYALPWVGFAITTAVFALAYLRWVARYSVVRALAYGLAMDVVAVVLFDRAGVVLPTGAYGF